MAFRGVTIQESREHQTAAGERYGPWLRPGRLLQSLRALARRWARGWRWPQTSIPIVFVAVLLFPGSLLAEPGNHTRTLTRAGLPGIFAIRLPEASVLSKWQKVLTQYKKERAIYAGRRTPSKTSDDPYERFEKFLSSISLKREMDKIYAVNSYFNTMTYKTDSSAYGSEDYWATPYEFLAADGGDCEDFAIAKMMVLRELGFDEEQLHLLVVYDKRRKMAHAVVAVFIEGRTWILNNVTSAILEWNASRYYYQPLYSVSELGVWLYPSTG